MNLDERTWGLLIARLDQIDKRLDAQSRTSAAILKEVRQTNGTVKAHTVQIAALEKGQDDEEEAEEHRRDRSHAMIGWGIAGAVVLLAALEPTIIHWLHLY